MLANIKTHLRLWFVAHSGNGHLPHLLRPKGISLGLIAILIGQLVFNYLAVGSLQPLSYASSINRSQLVTLTNDERANAGVASLSENSQLNQAAANKAQHMIDNDYWAHVAPDGTTPWSFVTNAGYNYASIGENLAKGFSTSSGVTSGWMDSTEHRNNMLNGQYTDVGFAVLDGVLQGRNTTLVVAFYGTPQAPAPAPEPAPSPAPEPVPAPAPEPTPEPEPEPEPEEESADESEQDSEDNGSEEELDIASDPRFDPVTFADNNHSIASAEIDYGAGQPLAINEALTDGEMFTGFVLSGFLLTNTMAHTTVWRKRKTPLKRAKHIWFRTHPVLQSVILAIPLLAMIAIMAIGGMGTVL